MSSRPGSKLLLAVMAVSMAPHWAARAQVQPAETVITIKGLCDQVSTARNDKNPCSTRITRQQFEDLVNSINFTDQTVAPGKRRSFAKTYVQLLAFEKAARDTGLEDTPEFAEILRWVRLRAVADVYRSKLLEKAHAVSAKEVDDYYQRHLPSYERVNIARVMVPRKSPGGASDKEFDQRALAIATAAHERLVKGEDPDTVQNRAYSELGLSLPPTTKIGTRKRADFVPDEAEEVFSLKPGEVSKLETDVGSYTAYKVVSKETLAESKVRDEISRAISERKFKDSIQSVTELLQTEYNQTYFGALDETTHPPTESSPAIQR